MQYLIKKGDTLSKIAQSYGVSVDAIMSANPKITNRDLIYAGDIIDIPVAGLGNYVGFWKAFWQRLKDLFR